MNDRGRSKVRTVKGDQQLTRGVEPERHAKGTAFFQPSACLVHVSVVGRGVIIMALLAPMRSNVPPSTKRHALHGDGDH